MISRTVRVVNLRTLQEVVYQNDLPVEVNVRNAYLQMERRDFNHWDYNKRETPPIEKGKYVVICGDWCAFISH